MNSKLFALAATALLVAASASPADARKAIGLYEFGNASGNDPVGGVITDREGTIFGTTASGGNDPCYGGTGCGTVYALSPRGSFRVIYDFQGGQDGSSPAAQLTLGPAGSLFGYNANGTNGIVFQLSPPKAKDSPWTFQVIYDFSGGDNGNLLAFASPLIWHRGALYGIADGGTNACGQFGCGIVFRLTPPKSGNGSWTEKSLFQFPGGAAGGEPSWLTGPDVRGSFYVSTSLDDGAVAQITPPAGKGPWSENVLTSFKGGNNGSKPTSLVLTQNETLYGIAGAMRGGLAFELADNGNGWTRTNIAKIAHGEYGPTSLAAGPGGTLVGTIFGYVDSFTGAVFRLSPPRNGGNWTYSELCNFANGPDYFPVNVVTGPDGDLFGVLNGGDMSLGGLFEVN